MAVMSTTRWMAALAMLAASCGEEIANPTGSCTAPGDGGRAGYHAPGDSTWLPDCQNPLRREYWRVFAVTAASAYTIPRIDGEPRLQPACADATHALASLVQRYGLCASAMSQEEVQRVNDMAPIDALTLTHFLHGQLRFTTVDTVLGIDPWPIPSDIIDACGLQPGANSAELTTLCERVRAGLQGGFETAYGYPGPGGVELVARLNELYGIPPIP
jgi:hypothetical protein